jgi:hypothetical protein
MALVFSKGLASVVVPFQYSGMAETGVGHAHREAARTGE